MVTPTGEVRRVADTILARILGGTYPSGLHLPTETRLSAELTCGRSTLREALRYLADLGLVRSRRGSGAMVQDYRREGTPALLPAYLRCGQLDMEPGVLAREMLRLRSLLAAEAVRVAATYASSESMSEARAHLARGPELESDPAAHTLNELDMYRALVVASGITPFTWMVNSIWTPLREINTMFALAMGPPADDFQPTMERLFGLIDKREAARAKALVEQWFEVVDAQLVRIIEATLAPAQKEKTA